MTDAGNIEHEPFFLGVKRLFDNHVRNCETATGITAVTLQGMLEFGDQPMPCSFDNADALNLNQIRPPVRQEDQPFLRIDMTALKNGQQLLLSQDTQPENYQQLYAIAKIGAGSDEDTEDYLREEGGHYDVFTAEDNAILVNGTYIYRLYRGSMRQVMRHAEQLGVTRELTLIEQTTVLDLIRNATPLIDNFPTQFGTTEANE
ncbi:MAG TPA: hypothetical protein VK674_00780 [Candidatus Limnocylindria bacterium]|nr:hypothetical protein [Candidatus Limnocylindria bacterium]